MSIYELEILRSLSPDQRFAFQSEFQLRHKDATVAVLLAFFLGGLGAHHFYLGKSGLGVLYLLFCWTFIPTLIALIECFFLSERVRIYNDNLAAEIATRVRLVYGAGPAPQAAGAFCTRCGQPMSASSRFCPACGSETPALPAGAR